MRGAGAWLLSPALLLLAACVQTDQASAGLLNEPQVWSDVFEVDLPPGCAVTSSGMKIDFQVFMIRCGEEDYAGVYLGNWPDESVPRSRVMRTSYDFPSRVQVWSNEIAGDQAKADAIAASVKVRKPAASGR